MISISVFGAAGRMGRLLCSIVPEDIRVIQRTDLNDELRPEPGIDVVVDFSLASAWKSLDRYLMGTSAALVSGTTGLGPGQMELLEKWAGERPVFHSSNMSVGIYVLGRLMKIADQMLGNGFDRELVEFHHSKKLDAPSGTAKSLLANWPEGTRSHAVRGGDIAGEHHLHYMGPGERLVLSHLATDRKVFALGAIRAVRFMAGKTGSGLYGMEDMLG